MSRYFERARDVYFYAWCSETERVDAFVAALSSLMYPGGSCNINLSTLRVRGELWRDHISLDEAVATAQVNFNSGSELHAGFGARWRWLAKTGLRLSCYGEEFECVCPRGPLSVSTDEWKDTFPDCLEIPVGLGVQSGEVEAAMASIITQQEAEDILLGLCASDAPPGVTTGAMTCGSWYAPIEVGATYHADGRVARDLALSWLYLHDGDRVERIAGLSFDALVARVEVAPRGAHVGVAPDVALIYEHGRLEHAERKSQNERPPHPGMLRVGSRARLPGDVELTREQVLAVLAIPPATLLEALEAAAVPDDEWRAVEPRALEILQATEKGGPTEEVKVRTGKHARFIERYAPYHVRRLPSGGVLLATHPYRTLWPLWSDALFLLGITP